MGMGDWLGRKFLTIKFLIVAITSCFGTNRIGRDFVIRIMGGKQLKRMVGLGIQKNDKKIATSLRKEWGLPKEVSDEDIIKTCEGTLFFAARRLRFALYDFFEAVKVEFSGKTNWIQRKK